jgi:hypothetical protein
MASWQDETPASLPSSPALDMLATTEPTPNKGHSRLGILDLSNEILLAIIKLVNTDVYKPRGPYDIKASILISASNSLLNLSLCSRRILQLTEPELHAKVHFNHIDRPPPRWLTGGARFCRGNRLSPFFHNSAHINTEPNTQTPPWRPSLRSKYLPTMLAKLVARPDLASHVRCIVGNAERSDDAMDTSSLTEEDWSRVEKAIRNARESEIEAISWIKRVREGSWDSTMTMMFYICSNLEKVDFEGWSYTSDEYPMIYDTLQRILDAQNKGIPTGLPLGNLQDVTLHYWDTESGLGLHMLYPFLKIKTIEKFCVTKVKNGIRWNDNDEEEPDVENRAICYAKELVINEGLLHQETLTGFLRQFLHLEQLSYETGKIAEVFEPPKFYIALQQWKKSLVSLRLMNQNRFRISQYDDYPMGSFVDFIALKSIETTACAMLGDNGFSMDPNTDNFPEKQTLVESLPPTLEHLSLVEVTDRHADRILEYILSHPPALKSIDLGWELVDYPDKPNPKTPIVHPGFTASEVELVLEECEKADIVMKMISRPPQPKYLRYRSKEPNLGAPFTHASNARIRFTYPYEGWEAACEEHGCDPVTGREMIRNGDGSIRLLP